MKSPTAVRLPILLLGSLALTSALPELKDVRPGLQPRRDEGALESGSSFSTAPLDAAAARARATAQWQNLCVKFDALWPAPSSGSHSSNADSPPDDYYHIVEQFLY
ncbi:hypothetical protein B0H14DRAFT_2587000 [Mycena olivaceomarginata]|nr:hypothetical protein B0H14DRAFT_2587000 [Mycena olivaceomarginata]